MLDTSKIIQQKLTTDQYFAEEIAKKQIYLHHTAGNANPIATAKGWQANADKIATAFIIGGKADAAHTYEDGSIVQCFSSKCWGYHLGLKKETFTERGITYQSLDRISIGIEVCNFGQLTLGADGKFKTYVNSIIPKEEVCELAVPYKGYKYFHSYTDAQLAALKDLIIYLSDKFSINKAYNEDIWDISTRALKGENGIFTHNSVRKDKVDMYPHPKLIAMLKTL